MLNFLATEPVVVNHPSTICLSSTTKKQKKANRAKTQECYKVTQRLQKNLSTVLFTSKNINQVFYHSLKKLATSLNTNLSKNLKNVYSLVSTEIVITPCGLNIANTTELSFTLLSRALTFGQEKVYSHIMHQQISAG